MIDSPFPKNQPTPLILAGICLGIGLGGLNEWYCAASNPPMASYVKRC